MDLTGFVLVGYNRKQAYDDFVRFENGFSEEYRCTLTYEEFCKELDKGYENSDYFQVARLYEDESGRIWYDNDYVG